MKNNSILLVDDEDSILVTLGFNLEKQGYKVETAQNGEEGIKKFNQSRHDLVVTDLMMEGLNGIDVLKEVKKTDPDAQVIVLSGHGSLTTAVEALRLGAFDYLQKPCDRSEFSIKIANCLDKQYLVRQHSILGEKLRALNDRLNMELVQHKKDQDKLQSYIKELEKGYYELDDFTNIASDDLHTPLMKIILFGEKIKEACGYTLDDQTIAYLNSMQKSAESMQLFIDDLLDCSKITTKEHPFKSVDLKKLALEVLENLEPLISEAGAKIEVGDLPTLEADPLQIHRLFRNLIGNSIKFCKTEVIPIVHLSSSKGDEGNWEIQVKDNGIGFDKKHLIQVGKLFQQSHEQDNFDDAGTSLSICNKVVKRHHGKIRVESLPKEGTTVHITLPEKQN